MRSKKTLAELTAWLSWDDSGAAPDAEALADFLGIELAEPEPPVGQRRRSPEGVEVVKTDDGTLESKKSLLRRSTKQVYSDVEATLDNTKELVEKLIKSKREP